MMQLILASNSPRRQELLKQIVSNFVVIPSLFEENANAYSARETARFFAQEKAKDVFRRYPNALVIGADTVVAFRGEILGKPKDEADAKRMLQLLSGNEHSVFTGICCIGKDIFVQDVVETKVVFYELSEEFIDRYVESGSPMDKAGAYGIQDGGLVQEYQGSYTNVVGLPTERLFAILEEIGIC